MRNSVQGDAPTREACLNQAYRIIEALGVEKLSLREVARQLGISHQAPYKHFKSRDHLLAEVIARVFEEFAEFLESRSNASGENNGLRAMGNCYLQYARENPLKYRLMFNTSLPNPAEHRDMMINAQKAFLLLQEKLKRVKAPEATDETDTRMDAMFIWSTLHGLASIRQSDALEKLEMPQTEMDAMEGHVFERMGKALAPSDPGDGVT